jgi:hypothetical protein
LRLGETYDVLIRYEIDETADVIVLPPVAGDGSLTDEGFGDDEITATGTETIWYFEKHLSVDEQMIPHFGRHSCKMFILSKPIRFGFKQWMLCSSPNTHSTWAYTRKTRAVQKRLQFN